MRLVLICTHVNPAHVTRTVRRVADAAVRRRRKRSVNQGFDIEIVDRRARIGRTRMKFSL